VIVRADTGYLPDPNRSNNILGSATLLNITIPQLTLGGSVSGTVSDKQDKWYRLTVPPGEDVDISGSFSVGTEAELYVTYGALPSRGSATPVTADLSDLNPHLTLPNAQGGDYFILVHGREGAGSGASLAPASFCDSWIRPWLSYVKN
jgi:hypothetical protein